MAAYFLPRNHESTPTEKITILVVAYLLVAILWWTLRKKEKYRERK
jgi:hypothetical protein